MSRRLIVRPEAEADITEAALWYDKREAGLSLDLTLEVRAAIRRAVESPLLHLLLRRQPEVRRVLARRFPYRIFFSNPSSSAPPEAWRTCACRPSGRNPWRDLRSDAGNRN